MKILSKEGKVPPKTDKELCMVCGTCVEDWVQPSISYKAKNTPYLTLILSLGVNVMLSGNPIQGNFGAFRDNNEVFFSIEASW